MFCGLSDILGVFVIKLFINEKSYWDYNILFWVGTGLQIISLIVLLTIDERRFKYNKKDQHKLGDIILSENIFKQYSSSINDEQF